MKKQGPTIRYNSDRLIGIELEFDSGNLEFRLPTPMPRGWHAIMDGSLRNGKEIVMTRPVSLNEAYTVIDSLSRGLIRAKTGINRRGGFHVHVGGTGWTIESAYRTTMLYTHFQAVIDCLVGQSRVGNRFAERFSSDLTQTAFEHMFCLTSPATSRADAKRTRQYRVVNPASVRCTDPELRSVEFRQGSPSKHTVNIWGWTAFLVALVDIAVDNGTIYNAAMSSPSTLESLLDILRQQEILNQGEKLADWVEWRYHYMNSLPENWESEMTRLCGITANRFRGIVGISQSMNMPYPQVIKLLRKGIELGYIQEQNGRYQSCYSEGQADKDIIDMRQFDDAGIVEMVTLSD